MKVVLLGGAGLFGRTVINDYAARLPGTCEFVIADYDYRTARKMAKRLGERFSARMVDASSPESLDKAARDGSVIVSLVGPWYRFGEQIIEGSIRAGHPIVTANMARTSIPGKKDELLKDKGIPCITGVSLVPGAIELIAGSLIEAYPRAGEVALAVSIDTGKYGGLAFIREYFVLLSVFRQTGGTPGTEEKAGFFFSPIGLFQKLALSLRGEDPGMGIELLSALQDMLRRRPRPGKEGGVNVDITVSGEAPGGPIRLETEKLFPFLAAMLAGATKVALEMKTGGAFTLTDISGDPLFRKCIEEELGSLITR